jgi:putative transposase
MNRGIDHQRVFFSRADGELFLSLVGSACQRFRVEVHAYCLMSNHYHLLVRCPDGGLTPLMHSVGSQYVRHLNFRLGRDGSLFRGRYHAVRLGSNAHIDRVGRYIHRNPLEVGIDAEQYLWSSLRYYVGAAPAPGWLRTDMLLDEHGGRDRYRAFVLDAG